MFDFHADTQFPFGFTFLGGVIFFISFLGSLISSLNSVLLNHLSKNSSTESPIEDTSLLWFSGSANHVSSYRFFIIPHSTKTAGIFVSLITV